MKLEYMLGLFFFTLTAASYLVLFGLGRKWRREFEARGIGYWQAPKEERVRELTEDLWRQVDPFYLREGEEKIVAERLKRTLTV